MGPEGHRRLIGNDVAIIFFLEEGRVPFDPSFVTDLGAVPQLFLVVQPCQRAYRIASFSKTNIKPFLPEALGDRLLAPNELKDYILAKGTFDLCVNRS